MRKSSLLFAVLAVMAFSGCSVIGGIFKAGAAVGIISVIVVIVLIIWIVSMFRK